MKKKQTKQQHPKREKDDSLKLGDLISGDIMAQLKSKQKELNEAQAAEKAAEEAKKKEERRLREKNKSFEELLGESDLNWKNYK
ncbi:YqkE family protein [Peribacillus sp. JNUCC 23]|uniref:YqkE family protein n=1 Tax=Peribacillus sp. NPDC096379 TaxID=3364393 RepID=UPI0007815CFE